VGVESDSGGGSPHPAQQLAKELIKRRLLQMRRRSSEAFCAYCGRPGADEKDHVVAKQFFPAEERYRGNLPIVASCGSCNRRKQRIEDGPAVLFQFLHGSDASRHVLTTRVPRTLINNRRLHASLRRGLHEVLVRYPSGLVVPELGIRLSPRELADAYMWFHLVTRGLYSFEFGAVLPADHTIHLLMAGGQLADVFIDLIRTDPRHQTRSFADGEFKYAVAHNVRDQISVWLYKFKSISIAALTLAPDCPSDLRLRLAANEWPAPGAVTL
jgi:hypothetical protein